MISTRLGTGNGPVHSPGERAIRTGISAAWLAALLIAAYVFMTALIQEDRAGFRTLHGAAWLIAVLRWTGWIIERCMSAAGGRWGILAVAILLALFGAVTLFLLRRFRPTTWPRDIAASMLIPLLAASAFLFFKGNGWVAVCLSLAAGAVMLGAKEGDVLPSRRKYLWLLPVVLAFCLRFYALAEVPNGYAEHAAVQHAEFTIPYTEALLKAVQTLQPQPFLSMAWNALLREHSGPFLLTDALGFALLGISLVISRLISAMLGALTVYIAYRVGEELDGIALGLVFSLFLALSAWHITVSRYGTAEHVLSALQLLLSVLYVMRALKRHAILDTILAAVFTALGWIVYAPNLIVPLLIGAVLVAHTARDIQAATSHWKIGLVGVLCFGLLSYVLLSKSFPNGLLQPNIRTGYLGGGPLLADWPKRLEMLQKEVIQLLLHAADPWFAIQTGGGLSLLETALLFPGLLLAGKALADRQKSDLGVLVLVGIPLSFVPAVFAPDESFRRLMPAAVLCALAAAFAFVRLSGWLAQRGLPRTVVMAICAITLSLMAGSASFQYFDRSTAGEDVGNGWWRGLAQAAYSNLGEEPVLMVIPRRNQVYDANRYMQLMAYNVFKDAKDQGVPRGELYQVTTCEDPIGAAGRTEDLSSRLVIVTGDVAAGKEPCTLEFLAKLMAHYPGSTLLTTGPTQRPLDLVQARP